MQLVQAWKAFWPAYMPVLWRCSLFKRGRLHAVCTSSIHHLRPPAHHGSKTCILLNLQVNGYPSSPFDTTKLVFNKPYRHLTTLENSLSPTPCDKVQPVT